MRLDRLRTARGGARDRHHSVSFYHKAQALHITVFFITGRHEVERLYTERNLRAARYQT